MKKFIIFLFVFAFVLPVMTVSQNSTIFAIQNNIQYYRIITEQCFLYKNATLENTIDNIYFLLPSTYFVKLKSKINADCMQVEYLGISGFINSQDVIPVYSTPFIPYAMRTFDVLSSANPVLFSTPTSTGNYVGTIAHNSANITYLGAIQNATDMWYYCEYTDHIQGILRGYIDANLVKNLTPYIDNTEIVDLEPIAQTSGILAPELKDSNSWILLALLASPILILLLFLLKPRNKSRQKRTQKDLKALQQITQSTKIDNLDF